MCGGVQTTLEAQTFAFTTPSDISFTVIARKNNRIAVPLPFSFIDIGKFDEIQHFNNSMVDILNDLYQKPDILWVLSLDTAKLNVRIPMIVTIPDGEPSHLGVELINDFISFRFVSHNQRARWLQFQHISSTCHELTMSFANREEFRKLSFTLYHGLRDHEFF